MKRALLPALVALPVILLWALSLPAQSGSVRPPRVHPRPGSGGQVHIPGFGFQPIVQERIPVFGLGFDAHHHSVLNRRRGTFGRGIRRGTRGGFRFGFSGGFRGRNRLGFGFTSFPVFPFFGTGSSVVVVQQTVPLPVQVPVVVPVQQIPVVTLEESSAVAIPVAAGLPSNWGRVRVARSSYPRETPQPPQLTLLVLKDETIIPARDYWLEDGRIFYVTSTGRQNSFLLRELDWEMTTELNAQRNVEFVLQSP